MGSYVGEGGWVQDAGERGGSGCWGKGGVQHAREKTFMVLMTIRSSRT